MGGHLTAIAALCLVLPVVARAGHGLRYSRPAEDSLVGWERDSLPIGNGWFGASVFGGDPHERVQVTHNAVLNRWNLTNGLEIRIDFPETRTYGYARGLSLDDGIAWTDCEYRRNGHIRREYFASYPDRVMVLRFVSDQAGKLAFRLRPEIPFPAPFRNEGGKGGGRRGTVVAAGDGIAVDQFLEDYRIRFACRFRVLTDGRLSASGDTLAVEGATEATVLFACDTNYRLRPETFLAPDDKKLDPADDPGPRADAILAAAVQKGYEALRKAHVADFSGMMGRAEIDLGADRSDAELTTDGLIHAYGRGRESRYLEETYWQYGRYLLVSSSRPGTLPANLQGVWNACRAAPWGGGYWHNINVQMNYWPAFNSNLAECFVPYAELNAAFRPATRRYAIGYLKEHGLGPLPAEDEARDMWCVGTPLFPYDACGGPGSHSGPGTGGLTTKLFDDWWEFTRDDRALRDYVWPTVHGMGEFFSRCLVQTNGLWLSKFSASPEQMVRGVEDTWQWKPGTMPPYYATVGCAFDQQMIWENSQALIKFAERLGRTDDPLVAEAKARIGLLDPVQVGADGQLKEYREEVHYGDIGQWRHRHLSMLVGLYPGTLVTKERPDWMAAAKYSLRQRGDDSTGWALAHRLNCWARLGDGDHCHLLIRRLLGKRTFLNLWDAHPPFQIDGNFGATAGITEMLVQSHAGYIDLLPALPSAWAKSGSFRGLCARGAATVDCTWRDGRPVEVTVTSREGEPVPEVRFRGSSISFHYKKVNALKGASK